MEYRRRIEAEDFNMTHTDCYNYSTFLRKKVKFILWNCVDLNAEVRY